MDRGATPWLSNSRTFSLVSAAETWAMERGYATMRVRSNVKRVEARPFYEGRGFVILKSQNVYEKTLQ